MRAVQIPYQAKYIKDAVMPKITHCRKSIYLQELLVSD